MTKEHEASPPDAAADGRSLDHVLAEFIRRRDAGQPIDIESLCAARPDLADALRSFADGEILFREMAQDDSVEGASALAETIRPGAGRDTDAALTGRKFGNYRVIQELGQGGMGAVYLADDIKLQRKVALKIPKFSHVDGPDARERFFREARAAAALSHPNVCPVFHADESDGTPYIAMALIDGQPLSRFVGTDEFRDARRVAELIRQVSDALQHAHDQGVIHRDLKPGNIMIDQSGQPIVTDFGLARRIVADQESRITQEGQLLGTPAYMSPEQIAGNADGVTSSTDIYALGVVLFELLTTQLPFRGSVPEVIAGALKVDPPKLSSLQVDVDPALESLCLQMLQKKPESRPASMRDVSTRLQKWLDQATSTSDVEREADRKMLQDLKAERQRIEKLTRAGKFEAAIKRLEALARHKSPAAAEFREWAIDQIPRVKARPARAKRNEPEMLKMAQQWMAKHDYGQAIQILRSIPDLYRSEESEELLHEAIECQEEADALLLDLKHCAKQKIYDGIDDNLSRFLELRPGNQFAKNLRTKLQSYRGARGKGRPYRFDNKGRLLALNEDNFLSRAMILSAVVGLSVFGLLTWAITIYLKNNDQTVAVQIDETWLKEQGGELTLDIDGDEHTLTATGIDLKVALGKHDFTVRQGDTVIHNPQSLAIEKNGRQVLRITVDGIELIGDTANVDLDASQPMNSVAKNASSVQQPDVSATPDRKIVANELLSFEAPAWSVSSSVAFSPDDRTIYANWGREVGDYHVDEVFAISLTGSTPTPVKLGNGGYRIALSPDGKTMGIAKLKSVELWDVASWTLKQKLDGTPTQPIFAFDISPDGRWAAAGLIGDSIHVWDTETGKLHHAYQIGTTSWSSVALQFSPDSKTVFTCFKGERTILALSIDDRAISKHSFVGKTSGDLAMLDASTIVSGSYSDNRLPHIVNIATGKLVRTFGSNKHGSRVAVSPERSLIAATVDTHDRVSLFDSNTGRHVDDIPFEGDDVFGFSFSNEGDTLAVVGGKRDGDVKDRRVVIRVWSLAEERLTSPTKGTADGLPVVSHRGSPDAVRSDSDASGAITWPAVSNAPRTPLPDGPAELVMTLPWEPIRVTSADSVKFSPDGRVIAAAGGTGSQVWDVSTGRTFDEFNGRGSWGIAFSPDGKSLYSHDGDGVINRHDAPSFKKVSTFALADGSLMAFAVSVDGKFAAGAFNDGSDIRIWDTATGQITTQIPSSPKQGPHSFFTSLAFRPGSHQLLVGNGFKEYGVRLLDIQNSDEIHQFQFGQKPIINTARTLSVSPDGKYFLAATGWEGDFAIVDIERKSYATDLHDQGGKIFALAFLPDGKHVITGCDKSITIWNPTTRKAIHQFDTESLGVKTHSITVSPDGRFAATACSPIRELNAEQSHTDGLYDIRVWRLPKEVWPTLKSGGSTAVGSKVDNHAETPASAAARTPLPDGPPGLVGTLKGHTKDILEITPSPDGRYLVSTGQDGVTNTWDLATSQVVRTLPLESQVYGLQFMGDTLLVGGPVGRLKRHRFDNGKIVLAYRGYPDDGKKASRSVGCIQPGHEAGTFVTCNFRGDVAVWRYDDPRPIHEFSTESVFQNAYPTAEGYLLSGYGTKQARLVDKSGTTIREMYSLESGGPIAVSPDRAVFLSLRDSELKEIEISTGKERHSYRSGWVNWRLFTPDGRFILCQDGDYNLQIWDRDTQQDIYRARLPLRAAEQAVSVDGRFLFFAKAMFDSDKPNDAHEIYIWRLPQEVWPTLKQ